MKQSPQVYSIAAHRGFADALVAGLVPRYADPELGLARLTLLLPSGRAVRTVTEAFIRHSGSGLLMPRMAVVGDLDLDETLGPLLDPLGTAGIAPAADPTRRWLRLAELIRDNWRKGTPPKGSALLRLAFEFGRTMDRLLVEEIGPEELTGDRVIELVGDLSKHWIDSLWLFARVQTLWFEELMARGEVDPADRRNRLFRHAAKRWRAEPPQTPIVAAGVTSASKGLADLLRCVARLARAALEEPEKRVAVVTPDRGLAARVVQHVRRWHIEADDSAGRPLAQTAAGRVLLLLADVAAERAAPVPLMALVEHPLVRIGEGRGAWLDKARKLELELRGPRKAPGLEALREVAGEAGVAAWWDEVEAILAPLMAEDEAPLAELL